METMAGWFADGRVIDAILVLVALEAVAVLGFRAISGRGPAPLPFVANLLAGAFLLLALRTAMNGGAWIWIAASLAAGLLAHLADLFARWEAAPARAPMARRLER